jgi:hypothetical protein
VSDETSASLDEQLKQVRKQASSSRHRLEDAADEMARGDSIRDSATNARHKAEDARDVAEAARDTAEAARSTAEVARGLAEAARSTAEKALGEEIATGNGHAQKEQE